MTVPEMKAFDYRGTNIVQCLGYLRSELRNVPDARRQIDSSLVLRQEVVEGMVGHCFNVLNSPTVLSYMIAILRLPATEFHPIDVTQLRDRFSIGKFTDFCSLLRREYYLPKQKHCTEDFIALILSGLKKVYRIPEIRPIKMPRYPELAVERHLEWQGFPLTTIALPDGEGKKVDSEYFFNIVNTAYSGSMEELLNEIRVRRTFAVAAPHGDPVLPVGMLHLLQGFAPMTAHSLRKSGAKQCNPYVATVACQGAEFTCAYP